MPNEYAISKQVDTSFQQTIENITAALKDQGFGILCQIDIKEKIKEKLGHDMDKYIILGACNPALAHEALLNEYEVGLFLPCNVIVYCRENKTFVSIIRPTQAMSIIPNLDLLNIAEQAEDKLTKALELI